MKHTILICILSILAAAANGQEAKISVLNEQYNGKGINKYPDGTSVNINADMQPQPNRSARTTTTYSRWYDYTDTFLNYAYRTAPCNAVTNTSSFLMPMWNDTTALFGNPDGSYSNNKMISAGLAIVPFNSYWNSTIFTGQTELFPSSDYYIDSISVSGVYARNNTTPAKRAVIDTFTIGVVNGNGPITSDLSIFYFTELINYCHDTLRYIQMFHDTINNHAGNSYSSTSFREQTFTFTLSETDTFSGTKTFGLTPRFSVPAGNAVGASISFKSGDISYPGIGTVPRDTIQYATTGNFKYGSFQPRVYYSSTGGLSPAPKFMVNNFPSDHSVGFFKDGSSLWPGWHGLYLPNWVMPWPTLTIPSKFQYPSIRFHISCNACYIIGAPILGKGQKSLEGKNLEIYPVPANDELIFDFKLFTTSEVKIVLKNMMGQVVVKKDIGIVETGKASIDTRELPNGVYFYEFYAGEGYETGKVEVAH